MINTGLVSDLRMPNELKLRIQSDPLPDDIISPAAAHKCNVITKAKAIKRWPFSMKIKLCHLSTYLCNVHYIQVQMYTRFGRYTFQILYARQRHAPGPVPSSLEHTKKSCPRCQILENGTFGLAYEKMKILNLWRSWQ